MSDNDKAMEEGKIAASQGEPITANPYPEDADEHGYWEEGYNFAAGTDDDGEPEEE